MAGRIFIANRTATVDLDGVPTIVHNGQTKVREGHSLLSSHPDLFSPDDSLVHYDVEQATAAPGEKRGDPSQSGTVRQKAQAPKEAEVPAAKSSDQTKGLKKEDLKSG